MKQLLSPSFGVLLVDDEPAFVRSLSITLERSCGINHLFRCHDSRQVLDVLAQENIGLVLLDLNMPYLSGSQVLAQIVESYPDMTVIIISGMNQVETAVSCIKQGAYDYFVKTAEEEALVDGVVRAVGLQELKRENQALRQHFLQDTLEHPEVFADILTNDPVMRSVCQYLESVAKSNQAILITGESGVGKELFAKAAHELTGCDGSLIPVNVAGLDDNVFSDTMFGHARGAFTGAEKSRAGMIEQAAGGTLFLDEIGDLSLHSQVKLLRLLQEGEYFPLGSDKPKRLQARIIVATHQNLEEKQQQGDFRKDLYYRLRTHQVTIPPLRQRKNDIPLLLDYFLSQAAKELQKTKPTVPSELSVLLTNYPFPGNVRELRAIVFDAMSVHRSKILSMDSFKKAINFSEKAVDKGVNHRQALSFSPDDPLPSLTELGELLVTEAMTRAKGNQSIAAHLLGISQPALSKRLKKMKSEPS